ncbi:MAG TPA: hypothetical protein VN381_00175 [Anaerovoracaceae bacterium]|nr:hypothetical protein [Anaerovoracaceae bacterium]
MLWVDHKSVQEPYISSFAYINMLKDYRFLMTQLAYLTREYYIAMFSGFGNAEAIARRLYAIPGQFQEKAELIFGTPLSEEFMNLLSMHVAYVRLLTESLINGDQAAIDYSVQLLYKNATEISAHYARANPFWDEAKWNTLLSNYISMLIQDATALAARNFERELNIFDRMLLAALFMGDYQTDGFFEYLTATRGKAV